MIAKLRSTPIAWLIGLFIVYGSVYAATTPLFEISDEVWHYPMVKTLADGNGLPVQDPANEGPWRQEGSQPPLYYAVMALATRWIDTSDLDQVRWLNPHADNGLITADGNNNLLIHTYHENWPWHGTVLAVKLIRLLSVLLGAGTVYCTYRLGLELAPARPALALAAAGFTAFTPMFLFISGSVNNDNLAILLSSLTLWLLTRRVIRPGRARDWLSLAALGAALGGALLSKESTLGLVPLAGVALLYAAARRVWPPNGRWNASLLWRVGVEALTESAIVFGGAGLICGWWYWRNFQLYGDWLGWNVFVAIVGRRPNPAWLAQLWGERVGFVQAYWGLFGGVNVAMPDWAYTLLNLLAGLAAVGLVWRLARVISQRRVTLNTAAPWLLLAGWLALIGVGLIRWTSITWASQGRLIFPAISVLSVLLAWGLDQLWSRLRNLGVAFMAALAAAVPLTVIAPHYAPPPDLAAEQLARISHRLDADFGGEMKLLGYDLATEAVLPGQAIRLTLYWQSRIAMDRNWSIFVHIVDEEGIIVAQRDRYPGQGALATTLMHPGQTFADDYVIPIPRTTYAPTDARVAVGLYDVTNGERLPLADGGNVLRLALVSIAARPGDVPNSLGQNFGGRIELAGYAMSARTLRPGEALLLTLYWRGLRRMSVNYSVFAHVRGEGITLWAGADSWPQQGNAPTSTWAVGQMLRDTYELTLAPEIPPGTYDVEVGLYDSATGARLQLVAPDGRLTDADFLYLSKIRVVSP